MPKTLVRACASSLLCLCLLAVASCSRAPHGFLGLTWGEDAGDGARRLGLVLDRWYASSSPTFETAMDVHPRAVLGVEGRVALVRDADRRLAGVRVDYDDCPREVRTRLAANTRREFHLGEDGAMPYVKWSDGSVVHLEARREGTCTLTVAGPAFGEAFAAALLRRGLGNLGTAMTPQ